MLQPRTHFVHLPDMEVTTGAHIQRDFPRHMHDSYCIGLVVNGARILHTQSEDVLFRPGEIFVLNPHQPHACQSHAASTCYHVISIKPDVMRSLAETLFESAHCDPYFESVRVVSPRLASVMRALCALAAREHDPLEREALVVRLLTRLIADYSDHPPESARVTHQSDAIYNAREYIHACYTRKLCLAELAQMCHLSPYHFQRTFVACMGLSPYDYLVYVRIKQSKYLLQQGLPVAHVAQDVGFVDQSHFTRSFKRVVGITPGYFARQLQ